jgi:serine/threonine-protein kinase
VQLAAGVVVAERFRLERPLGQGGMGAVWRAAHVGLGVPCALKFIHAAAATSPEVRERFEREARLAAQLRSPHVVQILDHGVWEGTPYIAMELLEGEDLRARLDRQGMLDVPELVSLVSQVARALTKAQAAGLVHRDLKPANVFLVRDDDREIAKVLDFGVAKATSPDDLREARTATGALLGTPFYMSPEQAQGTKLVDHRSDLWSLAVIAFQCLTGQLPFESGAIGDLLMKIIVGPLPVPSEIAPVPPDFDAWWARAAARDPAARFQTARELAEALALALGVTRDRDESWAEPARRPAVPAPEPAVEPPAAEARAAEAPAPPAAPPRASKAPLFAGALLAAVGLGAVGAAALIGRAPARDPGPPPAPSAPPAAAEVRSAAAPPSAAPPASAAPPPPAPSASAARPAAPLSRPPPAPASTGTNLPVGASCAAAAQCASGFCVDGVCCDSACTGRCMACTAAKKHSGGEAGICGFISGGEDPDRECGPGKKCDGTGACVTLTREQIRSLTGR